MRTIKVYIKPFYLQLWRLFRVIICRHKIISGRKYVLMVLKLGPTSHVFFYSVNASPLILLSGRNTEAIFGAVLKHLGAPNYHMIIVRLVGCACVFEVLYYLA